MCVEKCFACGVGQSAYERIENRNNKKEKKRLWCTYGAHSDTVLCGLLGWVGGNHAASTLEISFLV